MTPTFSGNRVFRWKGRCRLSYEQRRILRLMRNVASINLIDTPVHRGSLRGLARRHLVLWNFHGDDAWITDAGKAAIDQCEEINL